MPKIQYQECNFRRSTLSLIQTCNEIINEYIADGLKLTLRQLYYQLVSRDIIANKIQEYNRLGSTVNDARLAGLIDWDAIEDRTRNLASVSHWNDPSEIMASAAHSFRLDKWSDQDVYPEVWIEKEALAGVFERICRSLDVPYLSCRGYTSQSEMWAAGMRFVQKIRQNKDVTIFHFGDHDPSGIDMSRDIEDRIRMFVGKHVGDKVQRSHFNVRRIALNMDQVEQYTPPENPAKSTDTRFADYQLKFGDSSWELDALNPRILAALVSTNVLSVRDEDKWKQQLNQEATYRSLLAVASANWETLSDDIVEEYSDEIKHQMHVELQTVDEDKDGDE